MKNRHTPLKKVNGFIGQAEPRPRLRRKAGDLARTAGVAGAVGLFGLLGGALDDGPTASSVRATQSNTAEALTQGAKQEVYSGGPMTVEEGDTFESMANRALGINSEDDLLSFGEEERQALINQRQGIVNNLLGQNNGSSIIHEGEVFEPLPLVDPNASQLPPPHGTDGIGD